MTAKICNMQRVCGRASRSKSEAKKRKMMVAVFEVTDTVSNPDRHHSAMGSAQGASIRVCRGRLRSACNPGVCDCPDVACKLKKTKMQILVTLLKYAIFGLAVEEAVRYGIWSDASKTDALTQRYLDWAEDFFSTRNKIQRSPQQIYEMARIRYNLKNAWNSIIITLNDFIASIPGAIMNAPSYFTQKPTEPQIALEGSCELNKGIRDIDD